MIEPLVKFLYPEKRELCKNCPAYAATGYIRGVGDSYADIVFLSDAPSEFLKEKEYVPFMDRAGEFLKNVIDRIKINNTEFRDIKSYFTYSVQCIVKQPKIEVINSCSLFARQELLDRNPKVIVALGKTAMKSLGIDGSVKDKRGIFIDQKMGSSYKRIMCTYSPTAMLLKENQGLVNLFMDDLTKSLAACVKKVEKPLNLEELTKDYLQPKTIEEVKAVCDEIVNFSCNAPEGNRLISVDTETTGLETYAPDFRCIAISFSWDHRKAATILLNHRHCPYNWEDAIPHIKRVLECAAPKVFHNFQYDFQVLELRLGLKINNVVFDTMIAEHLLDENKKGYYGLKEIIGNYCSDYKGYEEKLWDHLKKNPFAADRNALSLKMQKLTDAIKELPTVAELKERTVEGSFYKSYKDLEDYKKLNKLKLEKKEIKKLFDEINPSYKKYQDKLENLTFEDVPVEEMIHYAAIDADVTRQVAKLQLPKMILEEGLTNVMKTISIPASKTLARMSYEGFKVDKDYLKQLEDALDADIKKVELEIQNMLGGKKFNLNATKDIERILVVHRNIPLTEKTAKNTGLSTDKDTLKKAYRDTKDEIILKILDYKEMYKARHTFLKNIRQLSSIDGKIHTSFHLTGTATGRLSSSQPNLLNVPKTLAGHNIKRLFVPDDPENEIVVNADYSAAEIRILAAYTQDEKLIKALNEGKDIHAFITSEIYRIPYEEIAGREKYKESDPEKYAHYDKIRTRTKRATFLIVYAGSGKSLYELLVKEQPDITEDECQRIMDLLLVGFPSIKNYMDTIRYIIKKQGYVTSKFGRRRRFYTARFDPKLFNSASREAINMPIQSTSSDVVLSQLVEMDSHIQEIAGKLKLTVYDSITLTVPKSRESQVNSFMTKYGVDRVKEKFSWLPVKFKMDIEIGDSYGTTK